MNKYAYLTNKPSEIIFAPKDYNIYVKYKDGSDKVMIREDYYDISSLENLIEILRDVISISKMSKDGE
jgi:hypothetical protein